MGFFNTTRRVSELENKLERISAEFKRIEVEWEDTYEKLVKVFRRLRQERAKLDAIPESEPEETPQVETSQQGFLGRLTPRQKKLQQDILRQRAGLQ